jgi:hypothetical protein
LPRDGQPVLRLQDIGMIGREHLLAQSEEGLAEYGRFLEGAELPREAIELEQQGDALRFFAWRGWFQRSYGCLQVQARPVAVAGQQRRRDRLHGRVAHTRRRLLRDRECTADGDDRNRRFSPGPTPEEP